MEQENGIKPGEYGNKGLLSTVIDRLCLYSAIIGGLILYCLAIIVAVSAAMRELKYGGITGVYELVEFACGISAFLFLPLCQLKKGHVTVDLFTNPLPGGARNFLENFWAIVFAICWVSLAWCMLLGGLDKYEYKDATQELELKYWIVYVVAVYGSVLSAFVAILSVFGKTNNNDTASVQ